MLLNIFNVDHGACALITTSNGRQLMVDCGHHSGRNWWPGSALSSMNIAQIDRLFITNFDEDHASAMTNLSSNVHISTLVTNPSINAATLVSLKAEHGMGPGIRALAHNMQNVFNGGPPPPEDFGDTVFRTYFNTYNPISGLSDTNNLSLVVFVQCGPHKIIFPGDLEKQGWLTLLSQPAFVRELQGVTIFVASHHGRENGYCPEVMAHCPNVQAVIFSDKQKEYQTQETVNLYRCHANGFLYGGERRRVLTTRRDNTMHFSLNRQGGGQVYLNLAA